MKNLRKIGSIIFCLTALLAGLTAPLAAQEPAKGALIGNIFDKDGAAPMAGAVLKLRHINTGAVTQSEPTDKQGFFRIENLAKGIYSFGITSAAGDWNANELIGILEKETTRIAISLNPYEGEIRQSMQEIAREQSLKENEARIGHVIKYDAGTKEAVVFIEKGALHLNDRIRVCGDETNFYQDVDLLLLEGEKVKRALAGQNPFLKVVRDAQIGDAVFLVCKKGIPPFFLTPCGIASVIGGAGAIMAGIIIEKETPVSPFKK